MKFLKENLYEIKSSLLFNKIYAFGNNLKILESGILEISEHFESGIFMLSWIYDDEDRYLERVEPLKSSRRLYHRSIEKGKKVLLSSFKISDFGKAGQYEWLERDYNFFLDLVKQSKENYKKFPWWKRFYKKFPWWKRFFIRIGMVS